MKVEDAFEELLGRQASDEERARLHRVRQVLGLADNDALWLVVIALEHYDAIFRTYPDKLAEITVALIDRVQKACEKVAGTEAAHGAQPDRTLPRTLPYVGRTRRDHGPSWSGVSFVFALAIAFGALCVTAGYDLAGAAKPFWATRSERLEGFARVAAATLGAPAGWMIFALLVPVAVHCGWEAWGTVRDPEAGTARRAFAWAVLGMTVVGGVAAVVVLGRTV